MCALAPFECGGVVVSPGVSVCGYPVGTQCVPGVAARVVAKIYRPIFYNSTSPRERRVGKVRVGTPRIARGAASLRNAGGAAAS